MCMLDIEFAVEGVYVSDVKYEYDGRISPYGHIAQIYGSARMHTQYGPAICHFQAVVDYDMATRCFTHTTAVIRYEPQKDSYFANKPLFDKRWSVSVDSPENTKSWERALALVILSNRLEFDTIAAADPMFQPQPGQYGLDVVRSKWSV